MAHFAMFLALLPHNFQLCLSPLGADFGGPPFKVSLGSAISSDVTNASTAKLFFVHSTIPSTFSVVFA